MGKMTECSRAGCAMNDSLLPGLRSSRSQTRWWPIVALIILIHWWLTLPHMPICFVRWANGLGNGRGTVTQGPSYESRACRGDFEDTGKVMMCCSLDGPAKWRRRCRRIQCCRVPDGSAKLMIAIAAFLCRMQTSTIRLENRTLLGAVR